MYKIGVFCEMTGLPISTIRYYEKIGILKPKRIHHVNHYAYYDTNSYLRAIFIIGLKEMGFKLEEMKELFQVNDDEIFYLAIVAKQKEFESEIERLTAIENKANEYLGLYKKKN